MDGWIVIPNWDKFQHYKDRHAPWLKDYVDQLDRDEYRNLTLAARGLLRDVRLLALRFDGQVPRSSVAGLIASEVHWKLWKQLEDAGFIQFVASKPASRSASKPANPEVERDIETPKSPFQKTGDNPDAQRRKAKAWIDNVLPHLEGVDLAYVIADEFRIHDQDITADLITYAQERMLGAPPGANTHGGARAAPEGA